MIHVKALPLQFHNKERQILLFSMIGLIVVCALVYVYFLNVTILNVIARKHTEQRISQVSVHINKLELSYMNLSKAVTPLLAESLGFQNTKGGVMFANLADHNRGFAKLGE
jgi:hypothetical protein